MTSRAPQNLVSRLATKAWQRRHPYFDLSEADHELPRLDLTVTSAVRWAFDHSVLAARRRIHGIDGQPWITAESRELLEQLLRPTDVALEFGSGGSTEWLSSRVARVTSIESLEPWHDKLRERLRTTGVANVDLRLVTSEGLGHGSEAHRDAYLAVCSELGPSSVDVVLDDAQFRDAVALAALDLLRPGGILVLDNANAYLPSPSRSPWKVDGPATPAWAEFLERVADWRHTWTTNGAWDTAIWIKP